MELENRNILESIHYNFYSTVINMYITCIAQKLHQKLACTTNKLSLIRYPAGDVYNI